MFKNLRTEALGVSGQQSELIEWTLSYGFRGLDVDLVEFQTRARTSGVASAKRLYDSAKLRFGGFALPVDWQADEETYGRQCEALAGLAQTAAELGCLRCYSRLAPANQEQPYHANFELHRKRIGQVAGILAPHQIRLAVGFQAAAELRQDQAFEFIHQLDPLLILLQVTGASNVGLLVDSWELAVSGTAVEDLRKIPADKWISLELADAPAGSNLAELQATQRLLPGETGMVDNAGLVTLAAELGYDGPVTPAPHRQQFEGQKREAIVKLAGQKLDELWRSVGLTPAGKLAAGAAG